MEDKVIGSYPNELRMEAVSCRLLILDRRTGKLFTELEHYFDENDVEIGYIAFPHSIHEVARRFVDGRRWGKYNLESAFEKFRMENGIRTSEHIEEVS